MFVQLFLSHSNRHVLSIPRMTVTATLVSKENARGNKAGVEDAVCQALFVGLVIAAIGTPLLCLNPSYALSSVFKGDAPALEYAIPYLVIRSFAFMPSLVSFVGFSAFRGILETDVPVKISLYSNIIHAALDPILIFSLSMGVPGAAFATLIAEILAAAMYLILLHRRQMMRWSKIFKLPCWRNLQPLLSGGLALQLRNIAFNLTFIVVARVTQSIDDSGVSAAAHAMTLQVFQIGGIFLLALSVVAQTVVPNELVERFDTGRGRMVGGISSAKATANRLMCWGFLLGAVLGALQIALLPFICKSTPILAVREAAVVPSYLASIFQMVVSCSE
jgi:putative MATE family efflux protein